MSQELVQISANVADVIGTSADKRECCGCHKN
jgi:hypothetical protein